MRKCAVYGEQNSFHPLLNEKSVQMLENRNNGKKVFERLNDLQKERDQKLFIVQN